MMNSCISQCFRCCCLCCSYCRRRIHFHDGENSEYTANQDLESTEDELEESSTSWQEPLLRNQMVREDGYLRPPFPRNSLCWHEDEEEQNCKKLYRELWKRGYWSAGSSLVSKARRIDRDLKMIRRHYRANGGDIEKASRSIEAMLDWREEHNIDGYPRLFTQCTNRDVEFEEFIKEQNSQEKCYVRGYDDDGRATLNVFPSRDQTTIGYDSIRHIVYNLERAIACTDAKTDGHLDQVNVIIQFGGKGMGYFPSLDVTRKTIHILQCYYPERLYRAFMVDPPMVFNMLWTMAKPFLDASTKEKIQFVHGKEETGLITDHYNLDQLEIRLGGNAKEEFDTKKYLSTPFNAAFNDTNFDDISDDDESFYTAALIK